MIGGDEPVGPTPEVTEYVIPLVKLRQVDPIELTWSEWYDCILSSTIRGVIFRPNSVSEEQKSVLQELIHNGFVVFAVKFMGWYKSQFIGYGDDTTAIRVLGHTSSSEKPPYMEWQPGAYITLNNGDYSVRIQNNEEFLGSVTFAFN